MRVTVEVKPEDRIAGLLEANNRYLMRARAAEGRNAVLALALDRIADAALQDDAENPLQVITELAADALADQEYGPRGSALAILVNGLVQFAHGRSAAAGWWIDPATGNDLSEFHWFPYVVGTKLMLMVSELAEAMEGHRKGLNDDKLPNRLMIEVELADALLRIADLAGKLGLDLGGALVEKAEFNVTRPDHQPGARLSAGGKAY